MSDVLLATTAERLANVSDLLAKLDPTLPTPSVFTYSTGQIEVSWHVLNKETEKQPEMVRVIRRAVGGEWRKSPWGDRFDLEQKVNDWLRFQIFAKREAVCTRRVVGTETVTVPAVEAQPEHTEERELVEWDCAPLLADEQPEQVAS